MINTFYDLPLWLSAVVSILAFGSFALLGTLVARKCLMESISREPKWGDICQVFSNAVIVFYGLLIALIIVASYEDYSTASSSVQAEANEIAHSLSLVEAFPEPFRERMESSTRSYISCVLKKEWPAQERGVDPTPLCSQEVSEFLNALYGFEPTTNAEIAVKQEMLSAYGDFLDARLARLDEVNRTIPSVLWMIVFVGAISTLGSIFLLPVNSVGMHILISLMVSTTLALMIFVIAAMDDPFRGGLRVEPTDISRVHDF
ncbi:DUF4239 domain-containing protein [Streptomyces sp. SCSIO 30461]|uniref:bestrophin-like domain n=1 Tax=Streptomyces sp. SCSIO 30461 TaxID=3118085 RepID=UPI0030CE5133